MNTIETIRAEIKRLKEEASIGLSEYDAGHENGICEACNDILSFLDTLEEEQRPEPYNPVYDEAYLNEKIDLRKKNGSWENYEEKSEKPTNLDDELEKFLHSAEFNRTAGGDFGNYIQVAKYFYELGRSEKPNNHEERVPEIKETGTQGLDEDIITIHLGKVLTEEQYNEVVKSIVAFMNTRWPGLLLNQFAN